MPTERIDNISDPRLAVYRDLKDRELAKRGDGRFIAEGHWVVQRLLRSEFETESVLVSEPRMHYVADLVPPEVPFYIATPAILDRIVGFNFHSGVIAVGKRRPRLTLGEGLGRGTDPMTVVICANLRSTENLGTIMRTAAGFGVTALVLGEESCDPFYRQAIRVSMGTVFSLPIVQSVDLPSDIRRMREQWGFEVAATVLADDAESLYEARRGKRLAIMIGSEDQGLPENLVAACDRKVTLPMRLNTDSLNASVAAGVFMYHFSKVNK